MFDYEKSSPLDVHQLGIEEQEGVEILDISYAFAEGLRVSAYLVVPRASGHLAASVFLHGGEQDRSAFLPEALALATTGMASLLLDEPSLLAMPRFTELEAERERYLHIILKLRRGLDLLARMPEIDAARLGYVGLSFGAWMGGVLAGVERRVRTYILIAGMPRMTEIWRASTRPEVAEIRESFTPQQWEAYLQATSAFDAIHYIGHASPASLFFQFARRDGIISEDAALEFSMAASKPKRVAWYDAQHHDIHVNKQARQHRLEWLREQLRLAP